MSKTKTGEIKTNYKKAYFPRLDQCLRYIRDKAAGGCTTLQELIKLLESARSIDQEVLASMALTDSPVKIVASEV